MARGSQDLVKKNSKLDSFLQRSLTAETYDRIRGYESCICVSDKENKAFKFVILSDEWIYLTENPPKSIQGVVHFRDVVSVELVSALPRLLIIVLYLFFNIFIHDSLTNNLESIKYA